MRRRTIALIVAHGVLPPALQATASPGIQLAEEMIGAYQAVESYHARWLLVAQDEAGAVTRSVVEIAFDRESGRLLVRREVQGPGRSGELLISDGQEIRLVQRLDGSAPPSTMNIDTDAITYWVIERSLSFAPIDLPLLLGEPPLLSWLHVTGGTIDAPASAHDDGEPVREFQITGATGGDTVSARLDSTSFIREATRAEHRHTFVLESLSVNEPLNWLTFDFDVQSAFLGHNQ